MYATDTQCRRETVETAADGDKSDMSTSLSGHHFLTPRCFISSTGSVSKILDVHSWFCHVCTLVSENGPLKSLKWVTGS